MSGPLDKIDFFYNNIIVSTTLIAFIIVHITLIFISPYLTHVKLNTYEVCVLDLVQLEDNLEVQYYTILLLDRLLTEQDPRHKLYWAAM